MSHHPDSSATTAPTANEDELEVSEPRFGPSRTRRPPAADPLPEGATITTRTREPDEDDLELGDGDGWADDEPAAKRQRSSQGFTREPTEAELAPLEDLLGVLVGFASMIVSIVRHRRRPELPPHVWMANEGDKAAIGGPLARIAARRAPAGVGGSSDLTDGIGAAIGTAGYVIGNLEQEAMFYGGDELDVHEPDLGTPAPEPPHEPPPADPTPPPAAPQPGPPFSGLRQ